MKFASTITEVGMDEKQLGYKLKQFREEAGLSQQEIAEKLEISFQQYQKYEYGSTRLTVDRLMQISSILHVPVEQFLLPVFENPDLHSTTAETEVFSPFERVIISPEEIKILKAYRKLRNEGLRSLLLKQVREWVQVEKDLREEN